MASRDAAAESAVVKVTDRGLTPTDLDGLWRVALLTFRSGLAPRSFDSAEKVCVAMAMGLELGMTCSQALRSIGIINGKIGIYGDALPALCWASGEMEKFHEALIGEGDQRRAVCTVRRKGVEGERVQEFSVADAKRAGLWGKAGPWSTYPDRMLTMRARSFALRDLFADKLQGLKAVEELADTPDDKPGPIVFEKPVVAVEKPAPAIAVAEEYRPGQDGDALLAALDELAKEDKYASRAGLWSHIISRDCNEANLVAWFAGKPDTDPTVARAWKKFSMFKDGGEVANGG